MYDIIEIDCKEHKSQICNDILRALPEWFGLEEPIVHYTKTVSDMPFYAAYEGKLPIGFVSLKVHNKFTAEIYVIGVLKEYHRKGIGKLLLKKCQEFCIGNAIEFLTVKTLDESREDEGYKRTRLFYHSIGFRPLEVFKTLWDEDNPCLFMAKYLNNR